MNGLMGFAKSMKLENECQNVTSRSDTNDNRIGLN